MKQDQFPVRIVQNWDQLTTAYDQEAHECNHYREFNKNKKKNLIKSSMYMCMYI